MVVILFSLKPFDECMFEIHIVLKKILCLILSSALSSSSDFFLLLNSSYVFNDMIWCLTEKKNGFRFWIFFSRLKPFVVSWLSHDDYDDVVVVVGINLIRFSFISTKSWIFDFFLNIQPKITMKIYWRCLCVYGNYPK